MESVKQFNNTLIEFFNDIKHLNTDNDLKKYHLQLIDLMKINSLIALENYIINILPYDEEISKRDYNFFKNVNVKIDDEWKHVLEKIKDGWETIDDQNKNIIFDYFMVLNHYAKEYFKSKYSS